MSKSKMSELNRLVVQLLLHSVSYDKDEYDPNTYTINHDNEFASKDDSNKMRELCHSYIDKFKISLRMNESRSAFKYGVLIIYMYHKYLFNNIDYDDYEVSTWNIVGNNINTLCRHNLDVSTQYTTTPYTELVDAMCHQLRTKLYDDHEYSTVEMSMIRTVLTLLSNSVTNYDLFMSNLSLEVKSLISKEVQIKSMDQDPVLLNNHETVISDIIRTLSNNVLLKYHYFHDDTYLPSILNRGSVSIMLGKEVSFLRPTGVKDPKLYDEESDRVLLEYLDDILSTNNLDSVTMSKLYEIIERIYITSIWFYYDKTDYTDFYYKSIELLGKQLNHRYKLCRALSEDVPNISTVIKQDMCNYFLKYMSTLRTSGKVEHINTIMILLIMILVNKYNLSLSTILNVVMNNKRVHQVDEYVR